MLYIAFIITDCCNQSNSLAYFPHAALVTCFLLEQITQGQGPVPFGTPFSDAPHICAIQIPSFFIVKHTQWDGSSWSHLFESDSSLNGHVHRCRKETSTSQKVCISTHHQQVKGYKLLSCELRLQVPTHKGLKHSGLNPKHDVVTRLYRTAQEFTQSHGS